MNKGKPYIIEREFTGLAWSNQPGTYINSKPKWIECMRLVAPNPETAALRAMLVIGDARLRVTEDVEGRFL
jgi:hypothetical protein